MCNSSARDVIPVVDAACASFECLTSAKQCEEGGFGESCNIDEEKCCALPGLSSIPECCNYINFFEDFLACKDNPTQRCCELFPGSAGEQCKQILGCVGLDDYRPNQNQSDDFNIDIQPSRCCQLFPNDALCQVYECYNVLTATNTVTITNNATQAQQNLNALPAPPQGRRDPQTGELIGPTSTITTERYSLDDKLSCCNSLQAAYEELGGQLPDFARDLLNSCDGIAQCIGSFNDINQEAERLKEQEEEAERQRAQNYARNNLNLPPAPPLGRKDSTEYKTSALRTLSGTCCNTAGNLFGDLNLGSSDICQIGRCLGDVELGQREFYQCCSTLIPELQGCERIVECIQNPTIECCDELVDAIPVDSGLAFSCSQVKECYDSIVENNGIPSTRCCEFLPEQEECRLLLSCTNSLNDCRQEIINDRSRQIEVERECIDRVNARTEEAIEANCLEQDAFGNYDDEFYDEACVYNTTLYAETEKRNCKFGLGATYWQQTRSECFDCCNQILSRSGASIGDIVPSCNYRPSSSLPSIDLGLPNFDPNIFINVGNQNPFPDRTTTYDISEELEKILGNPIEDILGEIEDRAGEIGRVLKDRSRRLQILKSNPCRGN